jgi:hypothetical protein
MASMKWCAPSISLYTKSIEKLIETKWVCSAI